MRVGFAQRGKRVIPTPPEGSRPNPLLSPETQGGESGTKFFSLTLRARGENFFGVCSLGLDEEDR